MSRSLPCPDPGVYPDTPFTDYLAWDAVSNSRLSKFRRSPAHMKAYLAAPVDVPHLVIGRAIHCLALEGPTAFGDRYGVLPHGMNLRTNDGKAFKERLLNQFAGNVLKAEEVDDTYAIANAIHAHGSASEIINAMSARELSIVWIDSETGLKCKARLDGITPDFDGVVNDLKSTTDASPEAFARSIYTFGYHRQGAFYLDGIAGVPLNGIMSLPTINHYVITAAEKEPPYGVATYRLTSGAIDAGRDQNRRDLARYAECVATERWPAYSENVQDISLPDFAWAQIDQEVSK